MSIHISINNDPHYDFKTSKGFGFVVPKDKDLFVGADRSQSSLSRIDTTVNHFASDLIQSRASKDSVVVNTTEKKAVHNFFKEPKGFGFVVPDAKAFSKTLFVHASDSSK